MHCGLCANMLDGNRICNLSLHSELHFFIDDITVYPWNVLLHSLGFSNLHCSTCSCKTQPHQPMHSSMMVLNIQGSMHHCLLTPERNKNMLLSDPFKTQPKRREYLILCIHVQAEASLRYGAGFVLCNASCVVLHSKCRGCKIWALEDDRCTEKIHGQGPWESAKMSTQTCCACWVAQDGDDIYPTISG